MTTISAPASRITPSASVARRRPHFRRGVSAAVTQGVLELRYDRSPLLRIRGLGESVAASLTALDRGRGAPSASPGHVELTETEAAQYSKVIRAIDRCLAEGVWEGDRLVCEGESLRPGVPLPVRTLTVTDRVRLSKFTFMRRRDEHLQVESPVVAARVTLHDPGLAVLTAAAASAVSVEELLELGSRAGGPAAETVHHVLELFACAGVLDVAEDDGSFASDTPVQKQWDFHDLLFHDYSRFGRTDEPFGGVFPYRGEIEPLAPVREHHDGPRVDLPRPRFDDIADRDPSLLEVMESRHSTRHYGEAPMTAAQLGEFLYRAARVRGTYGPLPEGGMPYPASSRPYPCGGAGYELEIYVTVRRCADLEPGVYHYEADTHTLVALDTPEALRRELLESASVSAGGGVTPDVLLTITSRFQRISWKYRSIAYAVTLKHTGVLYQTMYLIATAMGLGACGLGSGNSDLSARAFGLDYLQESGVGEFILGSLPHPDSGAPTPGGNPVGKPGADATWQDGLDPAWYGETHARTRGGAR